MFIIICNNADSISETLYFESLKEKFDKLDKDGNIGNKCSTLLSFK